MELHPYDGIERRFSHADTQCEPGLAVVAQLLGLAQPPSRAGALYDLSFYSGGIGIIDRLAITLPADLSLWADVTEALAAQTLEAAARDADRVDELANLFTGEFTGEFVEEFTGEDGPPRLLDAAVRFINDGRRGFQRECRATDRIRVGEGSGVNWWLILWGDDMLLNYLSYDQG